MERNVQPGTTKEKQSPHENKTRPSTQYTTGDVQKCSVLPKPDAPEGYG